MLAVVIGINVMLAVSLPWMLGAFWLADRLGVYTPEVRDTLWDSVFGFVAVVGGFGWTWWLANGVPSLLGRLIPPIRLRPDSPTLLRYASHRPDVDDQKGLPLAPRRLRVMARTRNVSLAGWLSCAAFWATAAVLAQAMTDEFGLTAFCLATACVLGAVGVLGFQRGLVADLTGIKIHNSLRHVRIHWAEVRSIDIVPVDGGPIDAGPVNAERATVEYHKLRFNERVTAEVPAGGRGPGQYLFTLRETLLSMQQTYSLDGGSPPASQECADHSQGVQAAPHPQSIQDKVPDPDARGSRQTAAPACDADTRRRRRTAIDGESGSSPERDDVANQNDR